MNANLVNVANIHTHIECDKNDIEYDEETSCYSIQFQWDFENEVIDELAENEFRYHGDDSKRNMLWINELKSIIDWKKGDCIYAYTKRNCDGCVNVYFKNNNTEFDWYDIILDKDGFIHMKDYRFDKVIKIDCVFNTMNTKTVKKPRFVMYCAFCCSKKPATFCSPIKNMCKQCFDTPDIKLSSVQYIWEIRDDHNCILEDFETEEEARERCREMLTMLEPNSMIYLCHSPFMDKKDFEQIYNVSYDDRVEEVDYFKSH
jgi:hypothetical protein